MTRDRKEQIQYLLVQYVYGRASVPEEALLFRLLDEEKENTEWQLLLEELMLAEPEMSNYQSEEWEPVVKKIMAGAKLRRMWNWKRIAVAASVLIIAGIAVTLNLSKRDEHKDEISKTIPADVQAPSVNRAMISLANGQKIYLDSVGNGTLVQQGNVKLVKLANGEIAYQSASGQISKEMEYNTLLNPRGSKVINMTLTDGSRVWLNAGSSVTYPVAFVGNERRVSITGEAYFEITHNTAMPFKVKMVTPSGDGGEVEVLGTHFDVNAYDDEASIKVTLLEGSVKVTKNISSRLLKPGQQAVLQQTKDDKEIKIVSGVDIEEVMAWKNGKFSFEKMDIEAIMREMARWYDVEVEYKDKITDKYTVKITRDVPVSQVFGFIEMTGGVHFEIIGNKIVVKK